MALYIKNPTTGEFVDAVKDKADLGSDGLVLSSQLPSFVDDVLEGYLYNGEFYKDSAHTDKYTPESGKIYVDLNSNITYRWSGSLFVTISETIALGETSSTAYRGDRGKTAYDHSQSTGNPHGTTLANLGIGNVKDVDQTNADNITSGTLAEGRLPNITIAADTGTATTPLTTPAISSSSIKTIIQTVWAKIRIVANALSGHTSNTSNPHSVTAEQTGVPAWARAAAKPSYAYSEISGTPTIPTIPSWVTDTAPAGIDYTGADAVKITGAQTVAGVKTFSSIPVLPSSSPTADNQATRKKYVDDQISAAVEDAVKIHFGSSPPTDGSQIWVDVS